MILLLSPSKNLQLKTQECLGKIEFTQPIFEAQAKEIMRILAETEVVELRKLLKCNVQLANQAKDWAFKFGVEEEQKYVSIYSFSGIAYKKLNAKDFTEADLSFAQKHLLIGSACYGLLRPLDLIMPYRLDFFNKLPDYKGDLRTLWRRDITDLLIKELKLDDNILINIASNETYTAFDEKAIGKNARIIDIQFKMFKNAELVTIPTVFAKQARGSFARYVIKNKIIDIEVLKSFDEDGMLYYEEASNDNTMVFLYEKL